MAESIVFPDLRRLLDDGAQLVEVLPRAEYDEERLPEAINIPLKTLDAQTIAGLDRRRAVVVYCRDGSETDSLDPGASPTAPSTW